MSKGKDTSLFKVALGILLAKGVLGGIRMGRRLAWRWRRLLTPLWVGFGLWLFAVLYRAAIPEWWPVVLALPAAGLGLAITGPKLSERLRTVAMVLVPDGLDRGTDGVLDRVPERAYLAVLTVWSGTYLAVRIAVGPGPVSGTMWQSGVLVLGGMWWWHRRIRVAGRADRYARRWGKIRRGETNSMELRALKDSKVVQVRSLGAIAKLKIKLAPAVTQAQVARACEALASYMPKMRPNSVFYAADEFSAQHCWFTFIPKDPWKGKIDHPLPEPGSLTLRELGFRLVMGIMADATELVYKLQHTLIVGQSGSGKSIWIHSLIIWLLACRDVIIVGIDMAGGATLGVWRKVLALPLATDLDQARHILERILAVIEDRERQLGVAAEESDDADDEFMPSPETPWIVLVIDEFPDLIAQGRTETRQVPIIDGDGKVIGQRTLESIESMIGRIGKRARKCGIRIKVAAQNGSKPDVGSKEFQAQLKAVVGLGLDAHASKVLWGELLKQGWNSTGLKNGQFLLRDEDHPRPEIAKGFFVAPRDRRTIVTKAMELGRPVLEPTAWAALMGTGTGTSGMVIDMPPVPREELDEVVAQLRDEGPYKVDDLCELPGMPARATVFRRLKKATLLGQAKSVDGVWHFIPPEDRAKPSDEELTIR
jgi:FtsK/SpoIIIE family